MRVNKKVLLGSTVAMVALSPLTAQRLQAAQVAVSAQAIINAVISLTKNTDINFGILTETLAGTASVNFTDTAANVAGGLNPAGGTVTSGNVTVKSQAGAKITISATPASFKIHIELAHDEIRDLCASE